MDDPRRLTLRLAELDYETQSRRRSCAALATATAIFGLFPFFGSVAPRLLPVILGHAGTSIWSWFVLMWFCLGMDHLMRRREQRRLRRALSQHHG